MGGATGEGGASAGGSPDPHALPRRYLTADIPGTGGRIRERPEDFLVDEIPAYEPSGSGEHIYLLVQKRGLSTMEMVEVLSHHFGVRRMDVGCAGLKDKHAITRQVVSIHAPGKDAEDFPEIRHERMQVLWADRHANKLRPGHLKGNRFSIRIRGVEFTGVRHAKAALDRLARDGVPNRVGEQRFGLLGNNHLIGAALVAGDFERVASLLLGPCAQRPGVNPEARAHYVAGRLVEALDAFPRPARAERAMLRELIRGKSFKRAAYAIDMQLQRFYLSAFQSAVFNDVLDARLTLGALAALGPGDLAFKHDSGAVFPVDDALAALPETRERLGCLEISPSGPMWGARMSRAGGGIDAMETAALAARGATVEQLSAFCERSPRLVDGKRRPLRVPLTNTDVEGGADEHGAYIRVAFDLPRGAFATAVLPEIMKSATPPSGGAPDGADDDESEE